MIFIDEAHQKFFDEKLEQIERLNKKKDVYYKSMLYILGVCKETRQHFNNIFDMKNDEININSIKESWQTGSSEKVTRMAFNLWNGCNYDSEYDFENGEISKYYNPSEIFCCSYAPYFYEGIKIRYPEYTRK